MTLYNNEGNLKILVTANKPSPDALKNFSEKLYRIQNSCSFDELINGTIKINNYGNTMKENNSTLPL